MPRRWLSPSRKIGSGVPDCGPGTEGGHVIDSAINCRTAVRRALRVAVLLLGLMVLPGRAAAQDAQARQAILVTDSVGHLALTLRAYAQLGLQVEPALAGERLIQGRTAFDESLPQLLRRAGKQLTEADSQRLRQRWRSIRDATFTRPSTEIGALMSDIGDDLVAQLNRLVEPRSLAMPPAKVHPLQERARQRQTLQLLAKEGLFGCWRADLMRAPQMESLRADFSRWLAAQEQNLAPLTWVQYSAQWTLLTTSLPREGGGCTPQAMLSLVNTTERLAQMVAAFH